MTRRRLLLAFIALAACLDPLGLSNAADAQQPAAPRRIGVVAPGFSADSEEARAFRDGLRAAGYVEGRDLSIDWWYGQGSYDGIPDAVAKAVGSRVDVIVVESTVAALATKHATQTIPIIMALVGDPVGAGLVESLGHPGRNITGLTNMTTDLMAKNAPAIGDLMGLFDFNHFRPDAPAIKVQDTKDHGKDHEKDDD